MTGDQCTMRVLSNEGKVKEVMVPSFRYMDLDLMSLLQAQCEMDMNLLIKDIAERPHQLYAVGDVNGYVRDVLSPFLELEPEMALRAATLFQQTTGTNLFPEHQAFIEH